MIKKSCKICLRSFFVMFKARLKARSLVYRTKGERRSAKKRPGKL